VNAESDSPRVLISYSHDSPEHEARVLRLADRLRDDGVDAVLDQYESFPPEGWIRWMSQQIAEARFVLAVCTPTYRRRLAGEEKPGKGLGATYEGGIIQQDLYDTGGRNEKFIPVIFGEEDREHIPEDFKRYQNYLLPAGYEDLYRLLTDQPKVKKPELGRLRAMPARQARSDFRNFIWNIPPRNACFTGRDSYLEAARQALTLSNAVALGGIGGIGKTQTAIEFAYRHRADYRFALWSSAAANASLLSSFAALANTLDLPEKNEKELSTVAAGVTRWLATNSGWLLVLDNIDTVEDLNEVWRITSAAPSGHVLITTRLQGTGQIAKRVEIHEMDPQDGGAFLLRRAGIAEPNHSDRACAERISEDVDGLPLALDQAAAFIEETPSTPAEYLDFYRTEGSRLRGLRGDLAADHPSVTVTFSLAFSRLADKNPAAADLVRACAFLAPDAIPEEVFTKGGAKLGDLLGGFVGKPLEFAEALRHAGRFALIRRNAAAKSLDIHRQVQEVVKDGMDAETRRLWAGRVVAALDNVFPYVEFQNWPQCESLLPHARVAARHIVESGLETREAARLLNQTAYYLSLRAEYTEAEPLYRRALVIYDKALGPNDPDTAASLNNLADLLHSQGRYEEAEPLYRHALSVCERALGCDHPKTATSLNNLAELFRCQGRYEEAEPLYRRSLSIREKVLAPDHPSTATSLNNLAGLYDSQGRYEEAEPLYRRALAIFQKALGPDHPNTATTLNNLGFLYAHQRRYEESEPLYRRALAIDEKALGPDHPDTIADLNNLVELLRNMGRDAEAAELQARTRAAAQ
jgi:tetratricopeptide (TPR) repeat protein